MEQRQVRVGQIINTHGLQGQVRVWPLTDDPLRLAQIGRVFLEPPVPGLPTELTITSAFAHKRTVIVTFAEVRAIALAEKLKDIYLTIPVSEVPPLADDCYYHFQLEGLQVVTEEGQLLGTLTQVLATGANDVYVIRHAGGERLIPALKSVVLKVDLNQGQMTVRLPEGLE
ncbi:ribosome maturation factor RimM [Heliophilum fasciatum]|uniref:Ribosome maturation factor RimM n=1 Tax=Heliophilum fasciatum TaxID=35700 RepID=A0A4V6NRN1_9FIRM|nr:ribosome maturation factor RimM [Heliophilum fasciatum]MCW2278435.1 16S rRNA processing protein RimM [Heliophilum fasciatum]TCP63666.1 16S rRNA processing protein RimM [Heliophilum fasciatum]